MNDQSLAPNLEEILADLMPAARRVTARRVQRQRTRRLAALAVTGTLVLGSGAVAAFNVIGSPAPPAVKRDIAAVDRGMPADLRLNPDVRSARAVAASGDSVVYYAPLKGGGYCAEVVTRSAGPRGAVCSTGQATDSDGMTVTVPFTDPVRADSPVSVSGRVAAADAAKVELVYPDGGSSTVATGRNGFYAADVEAAHLAAVHARGLALIARDADGRPLAQAVVPSDAVTPPTEAQRPHDPIELDTVSTERDLTLVLRVRGDIYVDGVDHMKLTYADGKTVALPLSGKHFDYAVPPARQRDLMKPGTVTAYDAHGQTLASRPVAAVAYWHSHER